MMPAYRYTHHSRTWRSLAILGAIYGVLILGLAAIQLAWWIALAGALCTLPALYDVFADRKAGVTLADGELRWFSGKLERHVLLSSLVSARFDTRWDLTVRVTLISRQGPKLRLPQDCVPPHRQFEAALQKAGLQVDRHHFTVF